MLRAYSMSANKMPDLFWSASHRLSQEAELLSSSSPVTGSPWRNKLRLYPCTVAVTIFVLSSEVLSGPVFSSPIHSGLALCGLHHLTTLYTFFYLRVNESHTTLLPLHFVSLLLQLFLLLLLLHPHVEEISNRTVYWASLLSSPKSALLLLKTVILLLVGSPYRQPQCMREKCCMIVWVHKKIMGSWTDVRKIASCQHTDFF